MNLRRLDVWIISAAVLAGLWCLATLAFVVSYAAAHGLHFEGPYAGLFAGDQLRYLAWIRDAGLHALIADPFRPRAPHLYLQPLFLISGLLWRAGLSLQLSYLVWTPIALLTLIWGYASFTGRFFAGREWAAALALALLFFSPLVPLFDYGGVVDANGANYLVIAAGHGAPYWQAWGFLPTVIALGLMPGFVLGLVSSDARRGSLAGTAAAGLLVAWLHPWGGLELLLMVAGLAMLRWRQSRQVRGAICGLVTPGLAVAAPLVYYAVLAGVDPAWSLSDLREGTADPIWPLLVAYLPLLPRRPPGGAPPPGRSAPPGPRAVAAGGGDHLPCASRIPVRGARGREPATVGAGGPGVAAASRQSSVVMGGAGAGDRARRLLLRAHVPRHLLLARLSVHAQAATSSGRSTRCRASEERCWQRPTWPGRYRPWRDCWTGRSQSAATPSSMDDPASLPRRGWSRRVGRASSCPIASGGEPTSQRHLVRSGSQSAPSAAPASINARARLARRKPSQPERFSSSRAAKLASPTDIPDTSPRKNCRIQLNG